MMPVIFWRPCMPKDMPVAAFWPCLLTHWKAACIELLHSLIDQHARGAQTAYLQALQALRPAHQYVMDGH